MEGIDGLARPGVLYFDFGAHCDTLVDIGGGKGRVLSHILKATNISNGILFDLADVIEEAKVAWKDYTVSATLHSGSLFDASSFPKSPTGRTCFHLRNVIHDWSDADSITILKNVNQQMDSDDILLISESLPEEIVGYNVILTQGATV